MSSTKHKWMEEPTDESAKARAKFHWHLICLILTGLVFTVLMTTDLDHNPIIFSFGPLTPNMLMETIDRIRRL